MATPLKTTTNFYCYLINQQVNTGDVGEPNEIIETWILAPVEAQIIRPEGSDWSTLQAENAAPDIGEYYSSWNNVNYVNASSWQKKARCRSHIFTTLHDGNIQAVYRFSTYYQKRPGTANTGLQLPTTVECASASRPIGLFRRNWVDGPPAALDQSAADIGGDTAILGTREPFDSIVPQARMRVRLVMDSEDLPISDAIIELSLFMGKRHFSSNATDPSFMGFPVRSCIAETFAINKLEGEFYEITIDIVWDKYYDHDQVPQIEPDGEPKTKNDGLELDDIRWTRVERDEEDFNKMFAYTTADFMSAADADRKALAMKGYWVP